MENLRGILGPDRFLERAIIGEECADRVGQVLPDTHAAHRLDGVGRYGHFTDSFHLGLFYLPGFFEILIERRPLNIAVLGAERRIECGLRGSRAELVGSLANAWGGYLG